MVDIESDGVAAVLNNPSYHSINTILVLFCQNIEYISSVPPPALIITPLLLPLYCESGLNHVSNVRDDDRNSLELFGGPVIPCITYVGASTLPEPVTPAKYMLPTPKEEYAGFTAKEAVAAFMPFPDRSDQTVLAPLT